MNAEFRQRVREVLDYALHLEPAERLPYLEQVCGGDEALRREVELRLVEENTGPLWPRGPIQSSPDELSGLEPGQHVGPYSIERLLGEGGFSRVALALREDDFPVEVALKVLPPGRESERLVEGFAARCGLLDRLHHPNIVRIYDAGVVDDGRAFCAMEYVDGMPIDEHCRHHGLGLRPRLELFLAVCSAVQFAHQHLLLHANLKPSKVLITEDGTPMVLELGLAKQSDCQAPPSTEVAGHPMALRHASPEQVRGELLTTASDVYALGLLLYQLLTERYPYAIEEGDSEIRVMEAIVHEEPRRPSAAVAEPRRRRSLAGDLDSIVGKAMAKQPGERYACPEQMAGDIRRYLATEEVAARPGTWSYRTSKFVRRHKVAAAAGALLVIASLGFGLFATRLAHQARGGQERSDQVRSFVQSLVRNAGLNGVRGKEQTAFGVLQDAEGTVEADFEDPLVQGEVLNIIGEAYWDLTEYERASEAWSRAEAILRREFPQGHPVLVATIRKLAAWSYDRNRLAEAETRYREALEMHRGLGRKSLEVAKSVRDLAAVLESRGAYGEAADLYGQALLELVDAQGRQGAEVATVLHRLGLLYYNWGKLEAAEPLLVEALAMREEIHGPEHVSVASALTSLGSLRQSQRRYGEAEGLLTRALAIRRHRLRPDHPSVALAQLDLVRLFLDTGELDQGEPLLEQALSTLRRARTAHEAWQVAEAESVLGAYLAALGRFKEAEAYLVKSHRTLEEARGPASVYSRNARRRVYKLYVDWGKPEKAAQYQRERGAGGVG